MRTEALKEASEAKLGELTKEYHAAWQRLEADWRKRVEPLYAELGTLTASAGNLFPAWDAGPLKSWSPPTTFAQAARFGQLDDYYILDEVVVYFGNRQVKVDPGYRPKLIALAEKAKNVNGYVIEVKGYASSSGDVALNQQLSEDRADEVVNILIQEGHIPLTRMLAPGAMGESHQVGSDTTAEGQAQNRRVVVRVLQNKAIAGI